jgi:O-antigen ligase
VTSNVRWTGRIGPTLLAGAFLLAGLLAGGFYESTYSLLAAAIWLGIAVVAAVGPPVRRPSGAVWALLGLTGLTLLSGLWGAAGPALRVAPLVALYAGALLAAEQVAARLLLRLTWLGCALVAALALATRLLALAPDTAGPDSDRLSWPLGYANGLGLVAVLGLLLALRDRSGLGRVAVAICTLAAVLTFSRTALLAGAAGLSVAAALAGRIPRRFALGGALALAIAAVLLAQPVAARFAAPSPDERDAHRLLDVSGHGRAELWAVAWEEGREHPLVGGGAGTWARAYVEEQRSTAAPANAHSLPLETFAELGLAGVALLAAFALAVVRRARRDPLLAGAFVAWAVAATADWVWQLPAATLPALFAAAALTTKRACVGSTQASLPPRNQAVSGGTKTPCVDPTQSLLLAFLALAIGIACAVHGVGAALLEEGKPRRSEPLLPFDARPWVALGQLERACRVDPGELALRRADPSNEGCVH